MTDEKWNETPPVLSGSEANPPVDKAAPPPYDRRDLQDYLDQVDRAYETAAGRDLEDRLIDLARQCGEEYGWESTAYASLLGELGGFYRGQGRFEESEARFQQAMSLLEARLGRESPEYSTMLNNLAGTHRLMGRLDQAEEEFRACLELYRAGVGDRHILYASGLNNLSLLHLDRGELEKALDLQSRAESILAALPQARDELASALCNQGALYQRLGRLEEAQAKLEQALVLFREELGTDTPHYHAALNSLGAVHYAAGRFEAARDCFGQAAQAARELYGPEHREVQAALTHRAMAVQRLENAL